MMPKEPTYALRSDAGRDGKAKTPSPDAEGRVRLRDPGFTVETELSPTLDAGTPHTVAQTDVTVRRLTPTECERLQGAPDGWTAVDDQGVELKDGPRYSLIGRGVAVPVARWIGERIIAAPE